MEKNRGGGGGGGGEIVYEIYFLSHTIWDPFPPLMSRPGYREGSGTGRKPETVHVLKFESMAKKSQQNMNTHPCAMAMIKTTK